MRLRCNNIRYTKMRNINGRGGGDLTFTNDNVATAGRLLVGSNGQTLFHIMPMSISQICASLTMRGSATYLLNRPASRLPACQFVLIRARWMRAWLATAACPNEQVTIFGQPLCVARGL